MLSVVGDIVHYYDKIVAGEIVRKIVAGESVHLIDTLSSLFT